MILDNLYTYAALKGLRIIIPFRLNNSAYSLLISSFTFAVGGASCRAGFARSQVFFLCYTQVSLPDPPLIYALTF